MKKLIYALALCGILSAQMACSSGGSDDGGTNPNPNPNPNPATNEVDFYLTTGDQASKLQLQSTVLDFGTTGTVYPTVIEVDPATTYQTIDGFGYTLTGGSVQVINTLTSAKKQELLNDLFGSTGIGVSYLRVSIGASDLSATTYTYDDLPAGQTDPTLASFSLAPDAALVAMLKEILAINPNIKIIATPWSAPLWMKSNNSFVGGSLKPEYYSNYAQYFVKYIQAMAAEGITITAVTPQNEPLHDGNNPSMKMEATEQRDFIKNNLGPAFQAAGITAKIIAYDHNPDPQGAGTAYATTVLSDAGASQYVDGSAWHLYAGEISTLSLIHNAFPQKNIYFTEQYTGSAGDFSYDLKWHLRNVLIGSMRNWSKTAMEWNLANDGSMGPHTNGGCTDCKGAITVVSSENYQKNLAYYIIAHASKFVPAGSVRIASTANASINNVAFKRPDGKTVLIAENDTNADITFNIKKNGEWVGVLLKASSVGTFVW
jgi:glucosylceramidase